MPKRTSKHKRKKKAAPKLDANQLAYRVVQESTEEEAVSPTDMTKAQISLLMKEMGRKGGKIGGKKRMEKMTAEQKSQFGLAAARSRWAKNKPPAT